MSSQQLGETIKIMEIMERNADVTDKQLNILLEMIIGLNERIARIEHPKTTKGEE